MAHLNLRDRMIETTIAYVAAEGRDPAQNFAHVIRDGARGRAGALEEKTIDGARVVSLAWLPKDAAKLHDCSLSVKLTSVAGDATGAMERMLVDADGLVLMLEADPEAFDRNLSAVEAVREVLSRNPDKNLPIVVQVDRREGVSESDVHDVPELSDAWPRVDACVAKGDGVMETLVRAVDVVVESMQAARSAAPPAKLAGAPRTEGNPLLSALRQMLQAAVSEQIAAFELKWTERFASREDAHEDDGARWSAMEARLGRIEAAVASFVETERARGEKRVTLDAAIGRVERAIAKEADAIRASDAAAIEEARLQRRAAKEETSRAIAAAIQPVQKTVDALATEARAWNVTNALAKIQESCVQGTASTNELAARVDDSFAQRTVVSEKIDAVTVTARTIDARVGRVAEALRAQAESHSAHALAQQSAITQLTEELAKRKKGWF